MIFVEGGGFDLGIEAHVLAQTELVGDEIQIAQVLGLAGETLAPMPLVEQFLGEGVAIGVALGIEAAPGIAVVVPGAAEIRRGLQQDRLEAEIGQPLDLIDAADAGADDDDVEFRSGGGTLRVHTGSHVNTSCDLSRG